MTTTTLADTLNAYAFESMKQGDYVQARRVLGEALRQDPGNKHALNNLAGTFKALGREPEAIAIYERLVAEHPAFGPPLNNLAFSYLRNGRYTEGWKMYRHRLATYKRMQDLRSPVSGKPLWEEPLPALSDLRAKNVLLVPEQGLGDELFFLRFAPRLLERSGALSIWYAPSPKLAPIFDRFDYPVVPCAMDFFSAPKENCAVVPIGDLPYVLGHDGSWFPPHPAFMPPPNDLEHPISIGKPGHGTLGVTWRAGNPELVHRGGTSKQIPPAALGAALKDWPGGVCIIQRNLAKSELAEFRRGSGERPGIEIFDATSQPTRELAHVCEKLATLSGYIGVSNTNMHLYAAMGGTAHVLLLHPAEWRWPVTSPEESPWFPGFRLYRQDIFGWEAATEKLRMALVAGL